MIYRGPSAGRNPVRHHCVCGAGAGRRARGYSGNNRTAASREEIGGPSVTRRGRDEAARVVRVVRSREHQRDLKQLKTWL